MKLSGAAPAEKVPVSAAAMAKRRQTRPEASFRSDSPSNICIIRLGIGTRAAMADTAIGSVGDTTAASAKATAKIGRASCRDRVWQDVEIAVVAGALKKKRLRLM